jgi:hypothetical protein
MVTVTALLGWSLLAAGTIALTAAGICWLVLRYRDVDHLNDWERWVHRNRWGLAMGSAAFVGCIFVLIGVTVFQVTGN